MHPTLNRRTWLSQGLAACAALAGLPAALAQAYPSKPIRLIVPYAAGGATDMVARSIGEKLSQRLGQPVIIENRPGAGGVSGTDAALKATPDGYTFLVSLGTTMLINQYLYAKLPYQPLRDQALISQIALAPVALLVHPSIPVSNANELFQYMDRSQGKLSYGSWGTGSYSHLACAYLNHSRKVDMVHAAYKGEAAMMQDLAGGQVQLAFASLQAAKPFIDSGRVKVLAVTGEQRMAVLPKVATMGEQGIKDEIFRITGWVGMSAPARTPSDIMTRVASEVRAIIAQSEIQQRISSIGFRPVGNTPEQFAEVFRKDAPIWERIVDISGAKLD